MTIGKGFADRYLDAADARNMVAEALATVALEGKRVLV